MPIVINPPGPEIPESLLARIAQAAVPTFGHYIEEGAVDGAIEAMIRPVKFVGKAFTVRIVPPDSTLVHKAVSTLAAGDVLVIDTGQDVRHAPVGEIVALVAHTREAAAIVIDGLCTDRAELQKIGLPVFARGTSALTTKLYPPSEGSINCTVSCGGVAVRPGDIVLGDDNGVIVLTIEAAERLIEVVLADDAEERLLRPKLLQGGSLAELSGAEALVKDALSSQA